MYLVKIIEKILVLVILTIISVGCSLSKLPEPESNETLYFLIKKSSVSSYNYINIKGNYYLIKNENGIAKSSDTGMKANYKYMYFIKRNPNSVRVLSVSEKNKLKVLLTKKNNFNISENLWFSKKNDVVIPIYSNVPLKAFN
jgi:hydroxymethylpyrimidine pyrophosphatase-like HAD family hydrolase